MKKQFTNLSVTVPVVTKAREIVAKMPFKTSVAQLAEALLTEAFAAIEAANLPGDSFPTVRKVREAIHGATYTAHETESARVTDMPADIAELRHSDPERFATIEARLANIESLIKAAAQPAKKKHS